MTPGDRTARDSSSGAARPGRPRWRPALLLAAVALGTALGPACGGGRDPGREGPREDAAETERYYVRLRPSADPRAVASRHGVEPLAVIAEDATAFYAALTADQVASLRRDTLVTSLSREIHPADDTVRPPLRGLRQGTVPDTGG